MKLQTKVRIKSRSECPNKDEFPYYKRSMEHFANNITYVQSVTDAGYLVLANSTHCTWRKEWLEILEEPMNKESLCPPSDFKDTFTPHHIDAINRSINTVGIKDEEVVAQGGTQFSTGAVRSGDANTVMYQLISPIGMRRLAETMKEGFDKYGAYNWERGMPIGDILNHGLRHIFQYLSGDRSEDHLAHAAWNLFASMHMEESHPELDHGLRPVKVNTEPMTSEEFEKILKG
jgi:hypothetical protein